MAITVSYGDGSLFIHKLTVLLYHPHRYDMTEILLKKMSLLRLAQFLRTVLPHGPVFTHAP